MADVISPEAFQSTPLIVSSSTLCKFLHHLSCYCISLNQIFPAFTLTPTFSNFRSSLQQMEPMPSQVRNRYWQKNQEAHGERALGFKKAANLHCPSNVCLTIICPDASYCGWLICPISLMNQDNETHHEIGDAHSLDTWQSSRSSDIEESDLDHQHDVLPHGQTHGENSLRTTRVSLSKKWSHADTVIACPQLRKSQNPPPAMAQPLLRC